MVASYTATEFASLGSSPSNPKHTGLTAHGWNFALADAKAIVATAGQLNIKQQYSTSDGTTRIYIRLQQGRLSPVLGICPNGEVEVDWGDSTTHSTVSGTSTSVVVNTQHVYAAPGDYTIKLKVLTGSLGFIYGNNPGSNLLWKNSGGVTENRVYQGAIIRVELGSGVTEIGDYMFYNCFNLERVLIPNTITRIGERAFEGCESLIDITIPSSVTSFGNSVIRNCTSLSNADILASTMSLTSSALYSCTSLRTVCLPEGLETVSSSAFCDCANISSIALPSSLLSVGANAFSGCYGLGSIMFKSSTPPAINNSSAFSGLPTDCVISVPSASLSAYRSATNYPSSSVYTYIGY